MKSEPSASPVSIQPAPLLPCDEAAAFQRGWQAGVKDAAEQLRQEVAPRAARREATQLIAFEVGAVQQHTDGSWKTLFCEGNQGQWLPSSTKVYLAADVDQALAAARQERDAAREAVQLLDRDRDFWMDKAQQAQAALRDAQREIERLKSR